MAHRKVSILLRIRTTEGQRTYVPPLTTASGKLKDMWGLVKGHPEHHPEGVYYIRWDNGQKRVLEPIGKDPLYAITAKLKREKAMEAARYGVELKEEVPEQDRLRLSDAVAEYLTDRQLQRASKTFAAARLVLDAFTAGCPKIYLDQLTRRDLLDYMNGCRKKGLADRTIFSRLELLSSFLRDYGVTGLLARKEWPKPTDKLVDAYSEAQLKQLFEAAEPEDELLFRFFLGAGIREQEAMHASWRDIDFVNKTFAVTDKPALGFRVKDKEERTIPLPDSLVEALRLRHSKNGHSQLLFPNPNGRPEGHFLRKLKQLAFDAGLNCGHCVNKRGLSCQDHPTCDQWTLHKFRRSFATRHHEYGISTRTLQQWLGHSDMEAPCGTCR